MKLKTIVTLLQEFYMPAGVPGASGMGSMTSRDTKLRPWPGSWDDVDDWDGIKEGKGWFVYRESNNSDLKRSKATAYITEGDKPHKMWIEIKTGNLRKPNDTNKMYRERVNKHSKKVMSAWMNAAKRLYNAPGYNEVGNKMSISWEDAFKEAINDPKVKQYVDNSGNEDIVDPVNFTPRV